MVRFLRGGIPQCRAIVGQRPDHADPGSMDRTLAVDAEQYGGQRTVAPVSAVLSNTAPRRFASLKTDWLRSTSVKVEGGRRRLALARPVGTACAAPASAC